MRSGEAGSQKVAVPTWTAVAPAIRNSAASVPVAMPPSPIDRDLHRAGRLAHHAQGDGLDGGSGKPAEAGAEARSVRVRGSMASAMKVLTSEIASAPLCFGRLRQRLDAADVGRELDDHGRVATRFTAATTSPSNAGSLEK